MPTAAADAAALEARVAVVAVARDDPAERRRAGVEQRAAGVVLESRHHRRGAVAEIGLEQHVADQPLLAGERLVREDSGPRHPRAVAAAIAAPEQLIAAADGEHCRAGLDGAPQIVSRARPDRER